MRSCEVIRRYGFRSVFLVGLATLAVGTGCATTGRLHVRAERYRVEVDVDPASHRIVGRTVLDVRSSADDSVTMRPPVSVELLLHPDLEVTGVAVSGVPGRYGGSFVDPEQEDDGFAPRTHRVILDEIAETFTVFVNYQGELWQDVEAGEVPGEIHNFTMRAHIGPEGIYLAGGYWYPQPVADPDGEPYASEYVLVADPVDDLELASSAQRDSTASEQSGRLTWRSPYPIDEVVLVGGPHEIHESRHRDTIIRLHLKPDQAKHAEGLFETVRRNLDRYEPLVGPYPAGEFAIVDNFFSSGFAFPGFTLLSSAVINMGKRSQTAHGYIDHEMLHCWWGNGVLVDPRDGNWCEALASYGANYYGYVLDGDETEARRKRRNYSHFLSRMKPEDDKPLGTYGQEDGCSRRIAYQKGAIVFHMLAREMGQAAFWKAMQRLTVDYTGVHASWKDIFKVCETVSGMDLASFEEQWVRRGGAPALSIESAHYDRGNGALTLHFAPEDSSFELSVPVRVTHADGTLDINVTLSTPSGPVTLPIDVIPEAVELDPDYHLFRKLSEDDIVPTTSSTRSGSAFVTVLPAGEVAGGYQRVQSVFESSFEEDERVVRTVGGIETGALAERCALVMGEAVLDSYVNAFLDAIEFPVRFSADSFEFDGVTYADSGHAILCTVAHPGVQGGGVTVVFANSEDAIPPAMFIPMYDRSLVAFKGGRPILRHDFERRHGVTVKH